MLHASALVAGLVMAITPPSTGPMLNDTDQGFVTKLAAGNAAEVATGKMCVEKCMASDVRHFGQMMVDDHTKAGEKFKALLQKKGITAPPEGPSDEETKLNDVKADQFDKQYMSMMVDGHKDVVALLEKEIKSGKDKELKQFAKDTLPTIKHHLTQAQKVYAELSDKSR